MALSCPRFPSRPTEGRAASGRPAPLPPKRYPARTAAALLVLALGAPVAAQQAGLDDATAQFQKDRKRLVEENLALTSEEAKKFWPLYEHLQEELAALLDKRRAYIAEYGENYDDMSDAAAKKLMVERLNLEESRYRLLKAFLPRFEKVLPVKKLARYFQIESKIFVSVEAGIAEELPLIKLK